MHKVISFPVALRDALFGTEDKEPTIPAPSGGWGLPNVDTEGVLLFCLPHEHITDELQEYLNAALDVTEESLEAHRAKEEVKK